jgi:hypothetical protein
VAELHPSVEPDRAGIPHTKAIMRIHDMLEKRATAARLFYLLEAHVLADVLGGASRGPAADRPRSTTATPADTRAQRAANHLRSRRIAFERSALRAEFNRLASNCAPS